MSQVHFIESAPPCAFSIESESCNTFHCANLRLTEDGFGSVVHKSAVFPPAPRAKTSLRYIEILHLLRMTGFPPKTVQEGLPLQIQFAMDCADNPVPVTAAVFWGRS
jgi:hypothetical protein